jgi:mono/diheme cytochrome c family protein/chitodextrinase
MKTTQKTFLRIGIFFLSMAVGHSVFAFSSGVTGYSGNPAAGGGNTCVSCHSGGTAPTVTLTGPATVQPGTINSYTLTITGGQANSGGLDVSVESGSLINTQSSTKLQSSEITHTARRAAVSGAVSWSFDWQAPTTAGIYTIYSSGLSTNGDGGTNGDAVSAISTLVTVSTAAPEPPTAVISAPQTAQVNETVVFDGSGSYDPDGTINSYDWNFGDGNTATGAVTNNTFTTAGTYTVTLTVTDADGLSHTTFKDITVGGVMIPVSDPGGPYTGVEGTAVDFDGSASTHVTPITNYIWDFGDGSPFVQGPSPFASHTYTAPGAYTVTLAVQDAGNVTGVANTTVVIDAIAPPPPPIELDGPTLYTSNCASCHGPLASSSKLNRSAAQIQAAIDANTGGMGAFSSLTPEQVQAIADALVNVSPPPAPTDGPTLYANNCAGCHGPLATSSKLNKTASQIQAAINANTGGMGGLSGLTPTQVQAIADALVTTTPPPPPPTDGPTLYANNCAACHGPLASSSKLNRTAAQITAAINANTGGMGGLTLTTTEIQAIANALVSNTPPPPPPADGQTLYANNCSGCHGPLATSSKLNKTASQIQAAINANTGGMGGLSGLSSAQVQAIADALVSTTPPPAPTTGEGLYNAYCLVCHGAEGRGGQYENVRGESAGSISSAINEVSMMNSLSSLSSSQIQAIASYLSGSTGPTPTPTPTVTGEALYNTYCLACHGTAGRGGRYEGVRGESASSIRDAIQEEDLMNSLSTLTTAQVQAISDYLNGRGGSAPAPAPTDGAGMYTSYCSGCHGPLASSSKLNRTAAQITAAINANTGGMGGLASILTATNIQAIADALSTGGGGGGTTPPPTTTDGATLYTNNCSGCHGPLASSSKLNRSASQIQAAINANTGGMGGLSSLTTAEVQAIADALASTGGGGGTTPTPSTGESLYISMCQGCHGVNGTGGSGGAIVGASANNILSAISSVGAMSGLSLTSANATAIADFLASGGGSTPAPTTGAELYAVKCQACHGAGGYGGSEEAVVGASLSEIRSAMQSVSVMQPIPLTDGQAQAIANYLNGQSYGGGGHDGGGHD